MNVVWEKPNKKWLEDRLVIGKVYLVTYTRQDETGEKEQELEWKGFQLTCLGHPGCTHHVEPVWSSPKGKTKGLYAFGPGSIDMIRIEEVE